MAFSDRDLHGFFISERYGEIALLTILNVLQTPPRKDVIKIEHCKLVNTSLKAIQDILPGVKSLLKRHLGQLLLTVKNYIFYGFPSYEPTFPNRASDSATRDSSSDMEPDDLSILKLSLSPVKERAFPGRGALKKKSRQKRGKRQKDGKNEEKFDDDIVPRINDRTTYRRGESCKITEDSQCLQRTGGAEEKTGTALPQSRCERATERDLVPSDVEYTAWARPSSSESEFSDSESGQARRLRSATAKVRNFSLVCLQTVIKNSDKKDLFGFWSSFISDGSGALTWSLFTIIQSDPNFKNRGEATCVLMDFLDGAKPFLAAADDSEQNPTSTPRPFTSFSSRLGSIIHELHRLLDVIPTETSSSTQVLLVKCMAMLVLNCPYHKLQQGLLSKVVKTIRPLLTESDLVLKQSALVCFGAVLTVNAPMSEVINSMQDPRPSSTQSFTTQPETAGRHTMKSDAKSETATEPSEQSFLWLVHECFQILRSSNPVSKDDVSDDVVCAFRSEALHLLIVFTRNYFDLLRPMTLQLGDMAHECLKEANPVIGVNATKLLQELGRMMYQTAHTEDNDGQRILVRQFWLKLLNGEVVKLLQSKDPMNNKCKAAACDCLSDIGANVLENFPLDKRILVITILLGLANDEDSYVKAASIRALGVYIVYPFLREDALFVTDTANVVVNGLNDSTLLVRMRSAWSLANLSDAFVMNKNSEDSSFVEDFSEMLLLRLINVSLKASEDNEKVKCNIVRTLGNFAKYLSQANLEKQIFSEAVENIYNVLTKCILIGQMKTRWNACYAAGNVFSNNALPTGKTLPSIQMFDALLSVVNNCKNFKVRINAVNALAVPVSRCCYGDEKQFAKVWSCLTETLSGTKDISDFSEFKYRDTLRDQISATICHITSLITPNDLEPLGPIISLHQQDLTQHLTNYYQNQLKIDEKMEAQISGQVRTTLFLGACDHILEIKQDSIGTIRTVFDQAKRDAEELMAEHSGKF